MSECFFTKNNFQSFSEKKTKKKYDLSYRASMTFHRSFSYNGFVYIFLCQVNLMECNVMVSFKDNGYICTPFDVPKE